MIMKSKKTIVSCLIAFLVVMMSVALATSSKDYEQLLGLLKHKKQISNQIDLLFLQQADTGTIKPDPAKQGCYQLTLTHLKKRVLYFSDQPHRIAGSISTAHFLKTWSHNYRQTGAKPNVAVQAYTLTKQGIKEIKQVFTLSNPKLSANGQSISYMACPLKSAKGLAATQQLEDINIFFDGFHQWPP